MADGYALSVMLMLTAGSPAVPPGPSSAALPAESPATDSSPPMRIEAAPRLPGDSSPHVRATLTDAGSRGRRVLLRHALSPTGPFFAAPMRCLRGTCSGEIPPSGAGAFTAWYFLEATDESGRTLAQAASAAAPLEARIVESPPLYTRPWLWWGASALVVGLAWGYYAATAPGPSR